jgi:hypothetical protein
MTHSITRRANFRLRLRFGLKINRDSNKMVKRCDCPLLF